MRLIRVNAMGDQPVLHGAGAPWAALDQLGERPGPAIVMIHGYRYAPGHPRHCPHHTLLSLEAPAWPRALGLAPGGAGGLGLAFGWEARGALWTARGRAEAAGRALARVIARVHRLRPGRPCHIVAHSLGVAPALAALPHLAPGAVGRIVALTGAAYQGEVRAALATPGGQGAEFINITSRENDPFDFLFERLIAPPAPGDRPIGQGLSGPRAVTLQIDCAATLEHLARIGLPMAPPARRVCHWSAYTRPGAMRAYARLLHRPDRLPLALLRAGLPERPAPRWSRLRPGWGRETGGGGGGLQPT